MLPLGKKVIIFDGGFGSELERRGFDSVPEELNVTHAETVREIHRSYACADIITANTFGLNRIKYKGKFSLAELADAAVNNARAAGKTVFCDVGPTGAMLAPAGTLSFDEAYEAFAEFARITREETDGYIAETFSDLYELKACVLALKENSDKPVFATVTFDASGRTLTGATPEIAAAVLEGLGVDALGVNCSLGPKELEPIVRRLLGATALPIIVQPNRGLPVLRGGKAVYGLGADEFDEYIGKFVQMGVSAVGGCCGTTPEFIERISKYGGMPVPERKVESKTLLCSGSRACEFGGVRICGERLNPTGKPKLKEALKAGDIDYLAGEAVSQKEAGADLLDLNVGLPGIDEADTMKKAVQKVQEYVDLPLCIDSSDAAAVETGVRYCNGIPLINSVNGETEVMARIFPVAKKYGAAVIGLAMDGRGVPKSARERFEIARKIAETADSYGIARSKLFIDTLTLTASAEQESAFETVKALALVKSLGVKTALGVSNISFGLPCRKLLNKTFLTLALGFGLDMPIMNPLDADMVGAVRAYAVLSGEDKNCENYIAAYKDAVVGNCVTAAAGVQAEEKADSLFACVVKGLKSRAKELAENELLRREPMDVINGELIPALEEVGRCFDSGKLFIPQLISSAEAAKLAFGAVSERLPKGDSDRGKIVLATVKGDVHDIGKNIVKAVLESYGYNVLDLGKDVPTEAVVDACKKNSPIAVGLSALMTTTVKNMAETVRALKAAKCPCPVFVGGAVLSAETAREIGADYYTRDALEFVKVLQTLS